MYNILDLCFAMQTRKWYEMKFVNKQYNNRAK